MNRTIVPFPAALLAALLSLSAAALAQVTTVPATVPTVPVVPLTGTQQAEGESFVSLARHALQDCGTAGSTAPPAQIAQYEAALNALEGRKYHSARMLAIAAINQCAAIEDAVIAQQEPSPSPSP
jgi:hypothetical protein